MHTKEEIVEAICVVHYVTPLPLKPHKSVPMEAYTSADAVQYLMNNLKQQVSRGENNKET